MENQQNQKQPFKLKIAGFEFGKKQIIIFCIIVTVIFAITTINKKKKQNEIDKRYNELMQGTNESDYSNNDNNNSSSSDDFDFHYQIQQSLSEEFGSAPDGFEWDYDGSLIPLGDESEAEDVLYMFLRALSILDFSTAERYSKNSSIIASYQDYYNNYGIIDYYDNFLRKKFKLTLTTLEVNSIKDTSVFADGTEYVTLVVSILNLQDKDFWRDDSEELFNTMRVYKETEEDDTKVESYLYEYIYDKYESGDVGKKTYTLEVVLSKDNGGGWLVENDSELDALLEYSWGIDIAKYIKDEFNNWLLDKNMEELEERLNNLGE